MEPRLPSSKKWTEFPKEYVDQIHSVFGEAFKKKLVDAKLLVEGRIYPHEILLRVGYLPEGTIRQVNFEVSIQYDPQKQNAVQTVYFSIDCAASMMDQFFQGVPLDDFPKVWDKNELGGREVWLQVSMINTELESEADKLLGEAEDDGLVKGETTSAEEIKASLGIDEE